MASGVLVGDPVRPTASTSLAPQCAAQQAHLPPMHDSSSDDVPGAMQHRWQQCSGFCIWMRTGPVGGSESGDSDHIACLLSRSEQPAVQTASMFILQRTPVSVLRAVDVRAHGRAQATIPGTCGLPMKGGFHAIFLHELFQCGDVDPCCCALQITC